MSKSNIALVKDFGIIPLSPAPSQENAAHTRVGHSLFFHATWLYLVAATIRLFFAFTLAPQPDEYLWLERSHDLLKRFQRGQYSVITNNLGHPGIPPAALMATGIRLFSYTPEGGTQPERLIPARIPVSLFAALAVPIVFLGVALLFELPVALAASLFLALDPTHVFVSSLAHLDATLSTLVALTVFAYVFGVKSDRPSLKIFAGVTWGMAIATKPTALPVLPALLVWRTVDAIAHQRKFWRHVVGWSDLWTVIASQAAFAAIYSRFWEHDSRYRIFLAIESATADFFYQGGLALRADQNQFVPLLVVLAVASVTLLRRRSRVAYHAGMLGVLAVFFSATLMAFPQVWENLARFWTWTVGLRKTSHVAYGFTFQPPQYGYLGLLASRIPELGVGSILLGLALTAALLVRWRSGVSVRLKNQLCGLILCIALAVLWITPLSMSSKQATRYIVPTFPFLFVVAAVGLVWTLQRTRLRRFTVGLAAGAIILVNSVALASSGHNLGVYFNAASGDVAGAMDRGTRFTLEGQEEALRLLHNSVPAGEKRSVLILGDWQFFRFVYLRMFPRAEERRLKLAFEPTPWGSDYVIYIPALFAKFQTEFDFPIARLDKVYSHSVGGAELLAAYRVPNMHEIELFRIKAADTFRQTGRKVSARSVLRGRTHDQRDVVVVAHPGRDRRGAILSGVDPMVVPGNYLTSVSATLPVHTPLIYSPDLRVLTLSTSSACSTNFTFADVANLPAGRTLQLHCSFASTRRVEISANWPGTAPIVLDELEFQLQ